MGTITGNFRMKSLTNWCGRLRWPVIPKSGWRFFQKRSTFWCMSKCRSCRSISMWISWGFEKMSGGCIPTPAISIPSNICISRSEILLSHTATGSSASAIGRHTAWLGAGLVTAGMSCEEADLFFGRSTLAFWTSCFRSVVHACYELVESMHALFTKKFINRHQNLHPLLENTKRLWNPIRYG